MKRTCHHRFCSLLAAGLLLSLAGAVLAQDTETERAAAPNDAQPAPTSADEASKTRPDDSAPAQAKPAPRRIVRMTEDYDLWIDPKRKLVIVDGVVCLREGQLEMFACPKGTKEHESVVALNCKSRYVHAALIAVGAEPGHPVQWDPSYQSATGTTIDILVLWKDKDGKPHKARAQEWLKHADTGKAMPYSWVFAGSVFFTDETTGEQYYQADGGDLICVSNFASATLDLPVESSQANSSLLFTAWTENIPPEGTKVRLVLIPRLDKKPGAKAAAKE